MPNQYLYQALNVKEDMKQKRLDAANALGYASKMDEDAKAKALANQSALDLFGQYTSAAAQQMKDMLPQDKQRFSDYELKQRTEILKQLKDSGVDPATFMMSGGKGLLNKYANTIITSDVLQQGIENSKNHVQSLTDLAQGKVWRNVDGGATPYSQAYDDFVKGKRKDLPYGGAIDPFKFDPLKFAQIENPEGTADNNVSKEYLFNALKALGYNESDAKQLLPAYTDPKNPNKSVFYWGGKKEYNWRNTQEGAQWLAQQKMAEIEAKKVDASLTQLVKSGYDVLNDKKPMQGSVPGQNLVVHPINEGGGLSGKNYMVYPQYNGYRIIIGYTPSSTGASVPQYKTIAGIYKDTKDGAMKLAFKEDLNEKGYVSAEEKLRPISDIYSGVIQPIIEVNAGQNSQKYLELLGKSANEMGVGDRLGFPMADQFSTPQQQSSQQPAPSQQFDAALQQQYPDYTEVQVTSAGTLGIKNGKWYDVTTGKEFK